jgi:hypothetical protein
MKQYRLITFLACLLLVCITACKKEQSIETGKLPPVLTPVVDSTPTTTPPPPDTTRPAPSPEPLQIVIQNPGFEDSLKFWKRETAYRGRNGFNASEDAVRTGKLGLNFYAAQPHHWTGAPQETPWNGKIYQTVKGLADGRYTFKVFADAVGNGMYLWADGGTGEVKVLIKSDVNEINTLEFEVKGGIAKFGFICIDANGPQLYAPYFHADDTELWKK